MSSHYTCEIVDPTESPAGPSTLPSFEMPSSLSESRRRRHRSRRTSFSSSPLTLSLAALTLLSLFCIPLVKAQDESPTLTLYTGGTVTQDASAPTGTYTGLPAYDPTVLTPPPAPQPPVTNIDVNIPGNSGSAQGQGMQLSIPHKGNFLGFSIELSVTPYVIGPSSGLLFPEFLNYMANIQVRAGQGPIIRVGGNTQDSSTLYTQGFGNGKDIEKTQPGERYGNAVTTPIVNYSPELLYSMANVSKLVGAQWYFGLPFNESDTADLIDGINVAAQYADDILGDNLLGLVIGNEPDLYVDHGHRAPGWNLDSYMNEYTSVTDMIMQNVKLDQQSPFVGPSVCCQVPGFDLQDVLNAGYLSPDNAPRVGAVTVQHYPENNCQIDGKVQNPQDLFPSYLNHTSPQSLVQLYAGDLATVTAAGKEMLMLETNTASCGGFPGLSDSFGAALWMTDYALQMAYGNFTSALLHFGGQGVYYNPFTPPPGTMPDYYRWTTGSVYFSALVVAEAFGKSNASQIVDLNLNNGDIYHPAYAIYENGAPTRIVLFNYVSDSSGASTYQAAIRLGDDVQMPQQVSVRYLSAPDVSSQFNITWAGQDMGTSFNSDGRLQGEQQTDQVQCPDGVCTIAVPAPSIALVFLNDQAIQDSSSSDGAQETFATTVVGFGSATIDPGALETSNGQNGGDGALGSNSRGSAGAADKRAIVPSLARGSVVALLGLISLAFI